MATINLQCNSPSQIYSSVYFRLIIVGQVEHTHRRSSDTNLAGIHEEMSELLDKQVNVQKQSLKKYPGSHKLLQAHKKECDENERKKMTTT